MSTHWEWDDYGHEIEVKDNVFVAVGKGIAKAFDFVVLALDPKSLARSLRVLRLTRIIKKSEASNEKQLKKVADTFQKHDVLDGQFGKTLDGNVLNEYLDKVEMSENKDNILNQDRIKYYREYAELLIKNDSEGEKE